MGAARVMAGGVGEPAGPDCRRPGARTLRLAAISAFHPCRRALRQATLERRGPVP